MSIRRLLLSCLLVASVATTSTPARVSAYRGDLIGQLWERYDTPVQRGDASRSWTWGPKSQHAKDWIHLSEEFRDSSGGSRHVVYFDKGRMEITADDAPVESPWYITSGLLPIELITGRLQVGYNAFRQRTPAAIAAVGDGGGFPTYADLAKVYQSPGPPNQPAPGLPATQMLNRDGSISQLTTYASDPATKLMKGENNHSVPAAFHAFQTQKGPIWQQNGIVDNTQVYTPLITFGLPVTAAYWVKTQVAGVEQAVLFQMFERRVLTYNPANDANFRVEMGNIGRHYYEWRYATTPFSRAKNVWNTTLVTGYSDPMAHYSLDVTWRDVVQPPGSQTPLPRQATYQLYFSPDGGKTRELRFSGEAGGCRYSGVALIAPRQQPATSGEIGLATQCADHPSESRGVGVTLYQSTDGGRSFWIEQSY